MGALQVPVVDVLPTSTRLGDEPRTGSPGLGIGLMSSATSVHQPDKYAPLQ